MSSARVSPTLRLRRLSALLRKLREEAGLTRTQVAQRAGWHPSKMTRIERVKWQEPAIDVVDTLLDIYQVADQAKRRALIRLAHEANQTGWWQSYTMPDDGFEAYIGMETEAATIRDFEVYSVHDLLQTEDYSRALTEAANPGISARAVDKHLELLTERQARLLYDRDPVRLWMILSESTLHQMVGSAEVMRAQVEHLRKAADLDNVSVQVLPFTAGAHIGRGGFSLIEFEDPLDEGAAFVHTPLGDLWEEDPDVLARLREQFEQLIMLATKRDQTNRILDDAAAVWAARA